jgi:hypothetical protein
VYGCECGPKDSREYGAAGVVVDRMGMFYAILSFQNEY